MILAGVAALLALAASPSDAELRGRGIFLHGESPGTAPISARLGEAGEPIAATLLPCANCHGSDGRGKSEGGVQPADISPAALGREATLARRTRPAYTDSLLKRAITLGFDAGGNVLDTAMPRFQMTQAQVSDLLAWLARIDRAPQSGVTNDVLRINVLGADGLDAPAQTVYGRRVELSHRRDSDAVLTIDAGSDSEASVRAANADGMPTIVVYPATTAPGASTFVLTASLQDQAAALQSYAERQHAHYTLLTEGCRDLATVAPDLLVLMTATAAAHCDLARIPATLQHRIVVTGPMPPVSGTATAQAALALVMEVLAQLGREVTRADLIAALEHVYRAEAPGLAPVTWSSARHLGSQAAWLMTLDVQQQRLVAEPGWVEAQ